MAKENKNTTATMPPSPVLNNPNQKPIPNAHDYELQLQHTITTTSDTSGEFIALPDSPALPMEDTKPTPAPSVASDGDRSPLYNANSIPSTHCEAESPKPSIRLCIYVAINMGFFGIFQCVLMDSFTYDHSLKGLLLALLAIYVWMNFFFGFFELLLYLLPSDTTMSVQSIKQAANVTGLRVAFSNWLRYWANKIDGGCEQTKDFKAEDVVMDHTVGVGEDVIEDEDALEDD